MVFAQTAVLGFADLRSEVRKIRGHMWEETYIKALLEFGQLVSHGRLSSTDE